MTPDKFTAIASMAALAGLLSLSALVSSARRPLPPAPSGASEISLRYPAPVRESLLAVGLLPVGAVPKQLEDAPEADSQDPKVALVTPLSLFSVGQCLDQALTENELEEARTCIGEQLGAQLPSAQELGQWVCSLPEGRLSQAQVMLEEVLTRLPGELVINFSEQVQQSCPSLEGNQLLARAVLASLATHADWRAELASNLTPTLLFDPLAGTLALDVAHQMALQGNGQARSLLEEGAGGFHGGSEDQILQAALSGLELQKDGAESMGFLTGVVESQFTPGTRGMGSFLADSLLQPSHWEAGDPASAVALLNRIVGDERFRLSAARALAGNLDQAPLGADQASWARLIASPSFKHLQDQVLMVAPD